MSLPLTARTEAGARLVALAESLVEDLARRAPGHDRDASFPFASADRLAELGYYAAPIAPELGGMGADSLHDGVVAASRLARGDASLAIGVNMHMAALLNMVGASGASGAKREQLGAALAEIAPAATVLYTSVCFAGEDGGERYGYAMVPADAEGVTVHGDWDALGMRASGSHSVSFDGVRLPASALRGGFPAGDAEGYMARNLNAGLFHASASLGIAEAAQAEALAAAGRGGDARPVAENAVDLAAAQRVVDRALALSGGAGYRNAHPLSRAYRDVRAGAFMHPLGANRAHDLVGRVALGADPAIH